VLVDSDGLWNYAATDVALAALVTAELGPPAAWPAAPLGDLCERLVSWAVDQGGLDNVTAALAPVPPGGTAAADDEPNQREEPA
jgi:serine/threonine protein phosphatase PrpC